MFVYYNLFTQIIIFKVVIIYLRMLYPNPALSVLNIKVEPSIVNQPYTIIDNLGRVVLNGKLNEIETTINVEQLSEGIYYLRVSDRTACKFIKE